MDGMPSTAEIEAPPTAQAVPDAEPRPVAETGARPVATVSWPMVVLIASVTVFAAAFAAFVLQPAMSTLASSAGNAVDESAP